MGCGLCLLLVVPPAHGAEPEATAPPPGQADAIPFAELGAHAEKEAKGEGVSLIATATGAELRTRFQHLVGTVDARGLWIRSTAPGEESQTPFQIVARRLGRTGQIGVPLEETGVVEVAENVARLARPGIVEEYSVSADGIRQDFLVFARPAGSGELQLDLALTGATAQAAGSGRAELILAGSGRRIAYHRLHVSDAHGEVLDARIAVLSPDRLAIHVDDTNATYPLIIDPTFTDSDWVSLGSGMSGGFLTVVEALAVDGSGDLYVGGEFTSAGGVANTSYIARWDGSTWHALGSGMNGSVRALAVDGSGHLYAGGGFTTAGGVSASGIARWDIANSTWHALGSGMNSTVYALAVDGSGNLYAGGFFTTAGGVSTSRIARWDGSAWSNLGSGMSGGFPLVVYALAVDGSGDLFAGGDFTTAGGVSASSIARWDIASSSWHALGSGTDNWVWALAVDGSGHLYAGGRFTNAGGVSASSIARWDIANSTWHALGSGMNSDVRALAVDSRGDLYAGGLFTNAGGVSASRIARWDGSTWSNLGSGISGGLSTGVYALAVDGSGDLYAGGDFTTAGGNTADYIAQANLPTNAAPTFDGDGDSDGTADTSLAVIENAPAQDVDALLAATDTDSGDTLTWAVQTAPSNGSLGGFPATASSTGGSVSPSGLAYTPNTNYTGPDSFTITVNDGWDGDVMTVNVTVTDAPEVTAVDVTDGLYGGGAVIPVTVTFDEAVTITSGTPELQIVVDSTTRTVTYSSGDGGTTLTFSYTVQSGELDTDGVALVADSLTGNLVDTDDGNAADLSHAGGADAGATVDAVAPYVVSITRDTPTDALTNAATVVFRVTFSEVVTGVDAADFQLTGTASASIVAVAALNSTTADDAWLVTIAASSDGTLGLALAP